MSTTDDALALLAAIEIIVNESQTATAVDRYQVTAGEPPAPSSTCSVVSVWASQFFNSATSLFHEDNQCLIVRGTQLNYRIDICYTEHDDGTDRTSVEQLATATRLYDLGDAVWCGIAQRLKTLFGSTCTAKDVDPMTFGPAQGGIVSAQSGVRLQADCPPLESVS